MVRRVKRRVEGGMGRTRVAVCEEGLEGEEREEERTTYCWRSGGRGRKWIWI